MVTLSGGSLRHRWTLESEAGEVVQVAVRAGILGSELPWLCAAAEAGLGPCILPPHVAQPAVEAGALVQLFPGWQTPPVRLSLIWLSVGPEQASLRDFIDAVPNLEGLLGG